MTAEASWSGPGGGPLQEGVGRRGSAASSGAPWRAVSWASVPLLFVAIVGLHAVPGGRAYDAPYALIALNFAFFALASLFVLYLIARSFLAQGTPALLMLGAGVLVWGAMSVVASAAGVGDPNVTVTIHNVGALLAGVCHVLAATSAARERATVRGRPAKLAATFAAALGAVAALTALARAGSLPTFFQQGHGGTPLRQVVLGSAVAAFAVASALLSRGSASPRSAFRHWYALGLSLTAVGLFGVLLQASFDSPLSWLGRVAQYLGAVSLVASGVASVREASTWCIPLDALLRRAEEALQEKARALRESERVYRTIGESIDYGVWVCAPDGRNTYFSESFLRLVGRTQEECSGFGWATALHPEDAERTVAAWKDCVRSGGTWDIEHRFRGVDGAWHPVLARGGPVRNDDGEVVCWAGIHLDIGRLKEVEQALWEADRRKNHFLAVLSHELRNPLAPIRNSVVLLRRAAPGSPQAQRAIEVIDRQGAQLARLVEDLLDVSRMVQGKIRLEKRVVRIADVVRPVVEDHRALAAAKGIRLDYGEAPEPSWVDVDAARVSQVVGNLLQNAIKFTNAGGSVELALEAEAGRAVLRVRDDGAGMDARTLGALFQPFMQADTTLDRSQGGLGLGLALARSLVELHGGRLEASSAGRGRGSEFVARIPLALAPAEALAAGAQPAPRGALRVLVIEDNEDGASSLRDLLELDGHEVTVAHDGKEGVAAAVACAPDVVLCDIGLPGFDGYEVARRLRALGVGARLVALTGYAAPDDVKRSRDAGFDHHLAKPPEPATLLATVAALKP